MSFYKKFLPIFLHYAPFAILFSPQTCRVLMALGIP